MITFYKHFIQTYYFCQYESNKIIVENVRNTENSIKQQRKTSLRILLFMDNHSKSFVPSLHVCMWVWVSLNEQHADVVLCSPLFILLTTDSLCPSRTFSMHTIQNVKKVLGNKWKTKLYYARCHTCSWCSATWSVMYLWVCTDPSFFLNIGTKLHTISELYRIFPVINNAEVNTFLHRHILNLVTKIPRSGINGLKVMHT